MMEPGFYWIWLGGRWSPAERTAFGTWWVLGVQRFVHETELIVGPRIMPPEEPPA